MQYSFTVSPMIQEINLKPGETFEGRILVANPADATADFAFKAEIHPYSLSEEGSTADFETETDWSQMINWMSLENTSGTLKPNEIREVKFTIKVPESASGGGQYAMIGVTSDDSKGDGTAISNIYEMASLIYANIEGETIEGGRVVENYVPGFVATGTPSARVTIENTGNVHETVTTELVVKNVFTGEKVLFSNDEENVYQSLVMPESTRTITRELENLPQLGIYEVYQEVKYLDDVSGTTVTMILCPIWFMALVVLTVASIIGMIFYGRHLKKKKLKNPLDF